MIPQLKIRGQRVNVTWHKKAGLKNLQWCPAKLILRLAALRVYV
jgi:hypothetical protein